MKPSPVTCSLCEIRHISKVAEAWCSICQKGFCNKCRYNHLSSRKNRGHKFISVERYHKETSPESVICKDHENKSHYFCPEHDDVVCTGCLPEAHKTCSGLTTLKEASTALKLSTVTADFDRSIKSIAGNIQKAISSRTKNLSALKEQKKKVEEEINSIRNHINDQLNKVQEELIHELSKAYQKHKNEIEECLKSLEKGKNEMNSLKDQSEQLTQSPSTCIQNFLKTLQMKKKFKHEETAVMEAIKGTKPVTLTLKPSPALQSFYDEVVAFGTIEVQHKVQPPSKKQFEPRMATRNGPRPSSKSLAKLKVVLRGNVKKSSGNLAYMKNCTFKSDGQIILAEPENKKLVIYDKKCELLTSITVPGHPFDIATINYCTIALTFEKQNTIQIMDTTYHKVSKTIHAKNICRGISYMNGQIFVVVKGEGIVVLDTLGQIKKTLKLNVMNVRFLCASNSRLCFTDEQSKSVHCCDLRGKELWTFKDKSIEIPQGITIDTLGNVLVVGFSGSDAGSVTTAESSYNVVAIAPDGSGNRVILKRPGRPSGIDFDKKQKRLVLYDLDGTADLFDVA